jgi:DNA-binding response OmpR family regulator
MVNKILIIDDDESILDAISLTLEDADYTVATSTKGDETYKKVTEFVPDLIILDVLMSGSDGRTICKKLKSDENTKRIPIVMISAHPSAKESVLDVGADAFLAKPFETTKLLTLLKEFV